MNTIIKHFFNAGYSWLFLLAGLILYYLGYEIFDEGLWKQIIIKFGDVFVIGVILGYITNVSALFGVFKKELESVIYAEKFLKRRTDLDQIWEKITVELFKSKFPSLHKDLLGIIKNKYLPVENISYYNDYNISINLEWYNKEKKIVKCTTKTNFELIAEDRCKIELPLQTWTEIKGLSKEDYSVKVSEYTVNNKPQILKETQNIKQDSHEYKCTIDLSGELKYEISQTIEKVYSFEKDYDISFKARYMINRLTVNLRHPSDITSRFIGRGTIDEYKKISSSLDSLEMKYKGLILPEQGYVIVLKNI